VVIQAGSVESIVVKVVDESGNIDTLPGGTTFSVFDADMEPVPGQQDIAATVQGMDALCVVDTGITGVGDFDLFLSFTVGAETPILGPHKFRVS